MKQILKTIELNHVRPRACLVQKPNTQTALPLVNSSLARNSENTNHGQMKSPPLHQTMNALNDEDRDISNRVHAFVMNDGRQRKVNLHDWTLLLR